MRRRWRSSPIGNSATTLHLGLRRTARYLVTGTHLLIEDFNIRLTLIHHVGYKQ